MSLTRLQARCVLSAAGQPCLEVQVETPLCLVCASGVWCPPVDPGATGSPVTSPVSAVPSHAGGPSWLGSVADDCDEGELAEGPLSAWAEARRQVMSVAAAVAAVETELTGRSCHDQREFDAGLRRRATGGGSGQSPVRSTGQSPRSQDPSPSAQQQQQQQQEALVSRLPQSAVALISRCVCEAVAYEEAAAHRAVPPVHGAAPQCPSGASLVAVAAHIARMMPGGASSWRASARMPVPVFTLLSGSQRAGSSMPFRALCLCPSGANSLRQAVRMGSEVYCALRAALAARYGPEATEVGAEGGFGAPVDSPEAPFDLVVEAVRASGCSGRAKLWLDAGADALWDPVTGLYNLTMEDEVAAGVAPLCVQPAQLLQLYCGWAKAYDIAAIQSPFAAADLTSWAEAPALSSLGCCVVAPTQPAARAACSAGCSLAGCVLRSADGTVTAAVEAAQQHRSFRCGVVVDPAESAGAPRTEDPFAAHLAVGLGAGVIKVGAPARGEYTALTNELLRIAEALEEQLQQQAAAQRQTTARYAGVRMWD
eukprot:TRINITY_DN12012_c1_g1_i1.p1 TRINITY_DN12012_c1_g1~~TRINITY_DN12012_c1_g1_i1.p1  ORF type:complete len:539 (+),score=130.30 TRINITY_DN12012_c1_g1_i1:102-1718(+)